MNKLSGFLKQRWLYSLAGIIALAILIWFIGPLLAFAGYEPLASRLGRVLTITTIGVLWVLNRLRIHWRARRTNNQLMEGMTADPAASATAEEIATLRRDLEEALKTLKKASLGGRGRQYLYQLPWYMLIGPPGSGKTTALVNSGLNFPLAERFGQKIRGIGGTRNCDWWFTDEAVLLDTAGRYTTQDSHREVDRAAWTGFLKLLQKHRRRRPINGALVVISIADLLGQSEAERSAHAQAIKQRIQELHEYLGIRFPIYVLLTKCDLLAGFMEFFDDLGREERAQVWGMTFPLEDPQDPQSVIERFPQEFTALEQRLNERLIERLQQERDGRRRELIFAFPQQFAALRELTRQFIEEVFRPSRYQERPLLRGVYFTSGTQEGTPIDRLMSALAATFHLDRQVLPSFSGRGRSYFLTRLLRQVIFPEAGLAGTNLRLERRRLWLQRGAYAGLLLLTVLAASAWFISYMRNQAYIEAVSAQTLVIEQRLQGLSAEQRSPLATLPVLNAARAIPHGYEDRNTPAPWLTGLGLYQGNKLGSQANSTYRRLLYSAFLPRIILYMEARLRQHLNDPDALYEVLKVYLMLGDPQRFDADTVSAWLVQDWERNLPREVGQEQRQQLQAHLDALLEGRLTPLPLALDEPLIAHARAILLRAPLAQRVYAQLKAKRLSRDIAEFRLSEAAGRDAPRVFERHSGAPLNKGIPGLYTHAGYHQVFTRESQRLIQRLAAESWVLGTEQQLLAEPDGLQELTEAVRRRYFQDYVRHWEELLADVTIIPFTTMRQAVDVLNVSSGPASPLRRLLAAVAEQTSLSRAPDPAAVGADAVEYLETGSSVEARFEDLNSLVQDSADAPPPLERILALLNELYIHMNAIASATEHGGPIPEAPRNQADGIIRHLKLEATRTPAPLNHWLQTMAEDSGRLILGGVRAHLNALWTTEVLPFYRQGLSNRYPLFRNSPRDATLEDFGRFFGPGGILDEFFRNHLQPFVDTSRNPWRWRSPDGEALGIPGQVLVQFQRADAVRKAWFGGGGQTPSVRFELKPLSMDPDVNQFLLDVDGQQATYSHGPARPSRLQWPGPDGTGQVRLQFSPPSFTGRSGLTEDGPWALFRLLDRSGITPTNLPERFIVTFQVDGRQARYELRASSAFNPFRLRELEQFRCPERL